MKNIAKIKKEKLKRRHARVRSKVKGTKDCPRLSVFRSNHNEFIQIIDDIKGKTLVGLDKSDLSTFYKEARKKTKTQRAFEKGKLIAEKAVKKGIKRVVFDKGGYKYHGRIKAVALGAREGGLKF